jgi:hypothetical protein
MWLARKRHPKNLRRHALSAERKWPLRASSRCCSGVDLKISRSRVRRAASPGTSGSSEVEAQSGPALASACRGETSQSVLSAAAKEAFIRRVLFDVGGFALFPRVVVMLRLLQDSSFDAAASLPWPFFGRLPGGIGGMWLEPMKALQAGVREEHMWQRTRAVRQTLPSFEIHC